MIGAGGLAVSRDLVLSSVGRDAIDQIVAAREIAFRLSDGQGHADDILLRPKRSRAALAPVLKACEGK